MCVSVCSGEHFAVCWCQILLASWFHLWGGGGGGMFPITQEYANINCFNVNIDAFYKIGFSVIYWAFCQIELSVQLSSVRDWISNEIELCMRLNFQWDWAFYKIELSTKLSFLPDWAFCDTELPMRLRFLWGWDFYKTEICMRSRLLQPGQASLRAVYSGF